MKKAFCLNNLLRDKKAACRFGKPQTLKIFERILVDRAFHRNVLGVVYAFNVKAKEL